MTHGAMPLAVPLAGLLMRCLVTLLEHPDQVRSLLVVSKIIHLLLAMLAPQVCVAAASDGTAAWDGLFVDVCWKRAMFDHSASYA